MIRRLITLVLITFSFLFSLLAAKSIRLIFKNLFNLDSWSLEWVNSAIDFMNFTAVLIISCLLLLHLLSWIFDGSATFNKRHFILYLTAFIFLSSSTMISLIINNSFNSNYYNILSVNAPYHADHFSIRGVSAKWDHKRLPVNTTEEDVIKMLKADKSIKFQESRPNATLNKKDAVYVYGKILKTKNKQEISEAKCVIEYYEKIINQYKPHPWCNYSKYNFAYVKRFPMIDLPHQLSELTQSDWFLNLSEYNKREALEKYYNENIHPYLYKEDEHLKYSFVNEIMED